MVLVSQLLLGCNFFIIQWNLSFTDLKSATILYFYENVNHYLACVFLKSNFNFTMSTPIFQYLYVEIIIKLGNVDKLHVVTTITQE